MLFLIKFKVYYNFINDNNDINYVTTSDCLNLTKVRVTLNKFNDTVHHINYIPIVKQTTDHLTYQIVTWIIFSIVLLIIALICMQCSFLKKNIINPNGDSNNTNNIVLPAELENTNHLDEIMNLDQLEQNRLTNKFKSLLINLTNNQNGI